MKSVSSLQIRAGRVLLNWTQAELAHYAGLSTPALNAIEQDQVAPRARTLGKIADALESAGVEFLDGHGTRLQAEVFRVQMFEGRSGFAAWTEETLQTLSQYGGEALYSSIDESSFILYERETIFNYYTQLEKLGFKERFLLTKNPRTVYGPPALATYRWAPPALQGQVGFSVYGNKYALIFCTEKPKDWRIMVVENRLAADAFRQQFEANWQQSRPIPHIRALYLEDKRKKQSKTK